MSGPLRLAAAHALHHPLRSLLLVLCTFVSVLLPLVTRVLTREFETRLLTRAASTPLVAGAKGSRFDLVMSSLYFRNASFEPVSMSDWQSIASMGQAVTIPFSSRFTAQTIPLVATSVDYFELRTLRPASGELPARIGDVVLGASAARTLNLSVGGSLYSDQLEMFDITKPPAMKLSVRGVLAPTGTPDDGAAFVDIKTAWVLEGLAHGHAQAAAIPKELLLDKTASRVVVSEELVDYNTFSDANYASFHLHADPGTLPITGVLVFPANAKEASLIKAKVNASKTLQMVVPQEAVSEMLGYVARLRLLLDGLALIMVAFTLILLGLVTMLSIRVRSRELETFSRIGVSRARIFLIFAAEIAAIVGTGSLLATVTALVLAAIPPDLVNLL